MGTLNVWLVWIAFAALCHPYAAAAAEQRPVVHYRGFSVTMPGVQDKQADPTLVDAVKEQIDIVCEVGLSPAAMAFVSSVPIMVEIDRNGGDGEESATLGLYSKANRSVALFGNLVGFRHRPVLLHELMHAYQDQRLSGGFENTAVLIFFARAVDKHVYYRQSHMMSASKEFFACSATTYLYGVTGQEPFRREALRQKQPTFYAWLADLFGPNAGKFNGSIQLTSSPR